MAKQSIPKVLAKRIVRGSLRRTAKLLRRSKLTRKAGRVVREMLFPENPHAIYNFSRFAPTIADYQKQLQQQLKFKHRPLISVVMPTYNTPENFLRECIESILIQSYDNWELCIADDASPDKQVVAVIKEYMKNDPRVKLVERTTNGHISEATNSAIEIARGEYIALMDHDDLLWPNALFEIVKLINEQPEVDFIYTDEDKIDAESDIHSYPFLKPDWSPEFLESCNYITHFSCIRSSIVKEVGGLRKAYNGAQDWDLFLRVSEMTDKVVHLPKILYSWRLHEASTAMDTSAKPYVFKAQKDLLVDHVARTGRDAAVKQGIITQHSRIEYAVQGNPQVSVIVYGRDARIVKKAADKLKNTIDYQPYEILTAHSDENLASSLNKVVAAAQGEYLIFVDATMRLMTPRWVQLLVGEAQTAGVGAVGGRTLSQSRDRFMRAGIALGIYGLYAPLLEYMSIDDIHYMRGLYGQSRRNVIATDSGCTIVAKENFSRVQGFETDLADMFMVDLCLKLRRLNLRTVYNPIIETVDPHNTTAGDLDLKRDKAAIVRFQTRWPEEIEADPYLHPYFTRTNAQLEMK